MNNKSQEMLSFGENVIIADADYIDSVAFNLIVNFERMIGRHIPQADMAQWVECIGLDGGIQTGNTAETTVVLVHDKASEELNNFNPGNYERELTAQAFKGEYGEFTFHSVATDEKSETMTKTDIMRDVLAALADEPKVKRVMIIPNLDRAEDGTLSLLMPVLRHLDMVCQDKRITLFAMQPLTGVPCRTEILGYSLMAALGIKANEIKD